MRSPRGSRGLGVDPRRSRLGAVIWSTISLQGSRIRSQTRPGPLELGLWPPSPAALLPGHPAGRPPSVELGSRPGRGDFRVLPATSARSPPPPEGGQRSSCWPGRSPSTLPVSALHDHAPRHQTSNQRETSPRITEPCASACDLTHSLKSLEYPHHPRPCDIPPGSPDLCSWKNKKQKKNSFPMIFDWSELFLFGFVFFFSLWVLDLMKG